MTLLTTRAAGVALLALAALAGPASAAPGAVVSAQAAPAAPSAGSGPGAPAAAGSGTSPAGGGSAGAATAAEKLAQCLSGGRPGDLLLLMDQSQSLQDTDPTAVRVEAAAALLRQLSVRDQAEGPLDVAVSGFHSGYERVVDWTPLDPGSVDRLAGQVEPFAQRDDGLDTDYPIALDGAREQLRERARLAGGERCQAVLWFTDGMYDVEPRDSADLRNRLGTTKPYAPGVEVVDDASALRAEAAGLDALCRPDGIADQLRSTGALTFAVGLGGQDVDFGVLRGAAVGDGNCGRLTDVVGQFTSAEDVDDLLFEFNDSGIVSPPTDATGEVHSFVLDASVRSVHVLARATSPGGAIRVSSPSGQQVTLQPGEDVAGAELSGQSLGAVWLTPRTVEMQLGRGPGDGWGGQWSVTFLQPGSAEGGATGRAQIRITGDLVPTAQVVADAGAGGGADAGAGGGADAGAGGGADAGAGAGDVRVGDVVGVRLGLASEVTQQPVPVTDVLGSATLWAVLVGADGQRLPVAEGVAAAALTDPLAVDLSGLAPGEAEIQLRLALRTADVPGPPAVAGTQLADTVATVPLTVLPPPDFPVVGSRVDFGSREGLEPLAATLAVTGPGCVWLSDPVVAVAPDEVGRVTVTSPASDAASCTELAEGEQAEIPLTLAVESAGTGTITGTITANLAAAGAPDRSIDTPVAFVADVVRPPDVVTRTWVFAVALLVGVGLPLLLLQLANWWSARIPGVPVLAGPVPARVSGRTVTRDGAPFAVRDSDLEFRSVDPGGTRELALPAGVTLRTTPGWVPTRPGHTEVSAPGRRVLVGPTGGRLPLAVHNRWVVLVTDPAAETVPVFLIMHGQATAQQYDAVAEDIRRHLPPLLERLRGEEGTTSGPPAPEPGFGARPGAPTPRGAPGVGGAPSSGAKPPSGTPGGGGGPFGRPPSAPPTSGGAPW